MSTRFRDELDGAPLMPTLFIDGMVQALGATPALLGAVERLAPFGAGNAEPRFVLPSQRIAMADVVGTNHVRCRIIGPDGGRLKAIAFRAAALHLAGRLKLDTWNGRTEVRLQIEDAAFAAG